MRVALLQDEIYLPSLAGGIKANRLLLESLAEQGHTCLALTRTLTRSPDGPRTRAEFSAEMKRRQINVHHKSEDVFAYRFRSVDVEALDPDSIAARRDYLERRLIDFAPDLVFVADDKRRLLLSSAMEAMADRVVPIVQTIMQLPFGPLAIAPDPRQSDLMHQVGRVFVISDYVKRYIEQYSRLSAQVVAMPVYGPGPFPLLADFTQGAITMINPCDLKGVSIFLELASLFPHLPFAAVPTWGCNERVLAELRSLPNMAILPPSDEIQPILACTRVLVVPSLWPETFGYVVPEAMLRGIPVLAAEIGGLPEAKLGVDYLLPVTPAVQQDGRYHYPRQEVKAWETALRQVTTDEVVYAECSRRSRQAALEFVDNISLAPFERALQTR